MILEPYTKPGQIKVGDLLLIDNGKKIISARCKVICNKNSDPEIVYHRKRNRYFITSAYLNGRSYVKDVRIVRRSRYSNIHEALADAEKTQEVRYRKAREARMDKQREEFERWAIRYSGWIEEGGYKRDDDGIYRCHFIEKLWQAWQAAIKSQVEEILRIANGNT